MGQRLGGEFLIHYLSCKCLIQHIQRTGFTQDDMKDFPHLLKWIDRVKARPAVQRGIGEAYDQKQ